MRGRGAGGYLRWGLGGLAAVGLSQGCSQPTAETPGGTHLSCPIPGPGPASPTASASPRGRGFGDVWDTGLVARALPRLGSPVRGGWHSCLLSCSEVPLQSSCTPCPMAGRQLILPF